MKIQEFDTVLLKDGRVASIVEVFDASNFLADIGDGPKTWDTIDVQLKDIEKVLPPETA